VLPASAFISVAEETGLIVDLGRWVLEEACRQMAVWLERHPELRLTMRVNVSPAQLLSPTLAQLVEKHLSDYGIPGRVLCLEITEHAVIQDVERSVRELGSLRALGVQLAIDDFGCGQSSMAQLKRLPVNSLKIDQSFVASIDTDPTDQAIVDSIIRLGNALGLELIAEGVERPTQAQELLALGCRRAQGFLYSRAVPAEHVEHMIIGREGAVPAQKAG
jgi:EAL domain-containing protein (putative c-di-GMP-specific phosphodiesterase class I)